MMPNVADSRDARAHANVSHQVFGSLSTISCRQHGRLRAAFEFWEGTCQPLVASTDAAGKPWRCATSLWLWHV